MIVYHFTPTELWESTIRSEGLVPQTIVDPDFARIGLLEVPIGIYVWPKVWDKLLVDFLLVHFSKRLTYDGTLLSFEADPTYLATKQMEAVSNGEDDLALSHFLELTATMPSIPGGHIKHLLHDRVEMDIYTVAVPPEALTPVKRVRVVVEEPNRGMKWAPI